MIESEGLNVFLTVDEILYLRKNLEFKGGYSWEKDIFDSLHKKIEISYKKPLMSKKEYESILEKEKEWCKKTDFSSFIIGSMMREKEYDLNFRYDINDEVVKQNKKPVHRKFKI